LIPSLRAIIGSFCLFVEIANHLRWCDLGRKDTKKGGLCVVLEQKKDKRPIFSD